MVSSQQSADPDFQQHRLDEKPDITIEGTLAADILFSFLHELLVAMNTHNKLISNNSSESQYIIVNM